MNTYQIPLQLRPDIFRAYDVRGVVGEGLTPDVVYAIGLAIGTEALKRNQPTLVVARDGRLSGPALFDALISGLSTTGCHLIDVGVVPTPVLYFATHYFNTQTGVMLTGSHNPSNYNGLKIVLGGTTLAESDIQQLYHRIQQRDFHYGQGSIGKKEIVPAYLERIKKDLRMERAYKVVIDCGNGVTGVVAPKLFRELGCEVIELYCEVDGHFPNHHPDPSVAENLQALIEKVKLEKADLGLAFDGDGDRVGVVTNQGEIIWPDRQMMLFAQDVLQRNPGEKIIFDVKCSRHLPKVISRHGGQPIMWKTGHSLLKAKMYQEDAPLAGEMSGHIFFKERWYGFDDGLYAGARLLEILTQQPQTASEVFAELPDSINTPELKVYLPEERKFSFMQELQEKARFVGGEINAIDGLRVEFPDGWGLVRLSNTTPCLTLRFEADNLDSLKKIQEKFRQELLAIQSDLILPF